MDGIGVQGMRHEDCLAFVARKRDSGRSRMATFATPGARFNGQRQLLREAVLELGPVSLGMRLGALEYSATGGSVVRQIAGGLDSLAAERGVRPGDELVAVDGVDVSSLPYSAVASRIEDQIAFGTIRCTFAATRYGDRIASADARDHAMATRVAALHRGKAARRRARAMRGTKADRSVWFRSRAPKHRGWRLTRSRPPQIG